MHSTKGAPAKIKPGHKSECQKDGKGFGIICISATAQKIPLNMLDKARKYDRLASW
jgi:hypothetical protein